MNIGEVLQTNPALSQAALTLRADPGAPFPVLCAKFKLTWDCNLKCALCNIWRRDDEDRRPRKLEAEKVIAAITSLKSQGLRKVHFSGGEVLIYKEFKEIVSHARSLDLQVNLTTNGTLLDNEAARFLIEQRVHAVNISIDSGLEKQHDEMRGIKGAWRRTWKGLNTLLDRRERKGRGPVIGVNTLVTRENAHTLDALYETLIASGVDRWRLLGVDTLDKNRRPTRQQWMELSEKMEKWLPILARAPIDLGSSKSAALAEKGLYAGEFYKGRACFAPWFNLFVDADGAAYPCCMGKNDMLPYGNLADKPVSELLSGARSGETRCTMATGHVFPVCDRCDDFLEENLAFGSLYENRTL